MLDSDLAQLYQTETKYINRAMNRNSDRFPEAFSFQLTNGSNKLYDSITQCWKGSPGTNILAY